MSGVRVPLRPPRSLLSNPVLQRPGFLTASALDGTELQASRDFLSKHLTETTVGPHTAWIGWDASGGCAEAPEAGYDPSVITWIDGDLLLDIAVTPVPGCEDSPLEVEDVRKLAESMISCSDGLERCAPMYASEAEGR